MKKLILSALLLAGMTFVACSSDDDNNETFAEGDCVFCEATENNGIIIEAETVCKSEDGKAIVNGEEFNTSFEEYVRTNRMFTTCKRTEPVPTPEPETEE